MKKTLTILLFSISLSNFSQKSIDAYKAEADGYFITPVNTPYGIVASDNFCSKLFLISNNEIKTLVNAPGCGRYFNVSPDRSKIAFKLIKETGEQVPAVYDLSSQKVTELAKPAKQCGQPGFFKGGYFYSDEKKLELVWNSNDNSGKLGGINSKNPWLSNIIAISPDGNEVVYNNDDEQLVYISSNSYDEIIITNGNGGFLFPQWSPDGNKLLYSSLTGNLFVWNKTTNTTVSIGAGLHAVWADDSQFVFFGKTVTKKENLVSSDIYRANVTNGESVNITNTSDVNEMYPTVSGNEIFYSTYEKVGIQSIQLTNGAITDRYEYSGKLNDKQSLFSATETNNQKTLATTMVAGTVPYIHQMYDTPDWHGGSGSCAPTDANMVLAYYNRLPPWEMNCSWPSAHTNLYGAYVADKYRYNEFYYDAIAGDSNSNDAWGGYGYMWSGSNSPHAVMKDYLLAHNVNSSQSYSTTYNDVVAQIDSNYLMSICNLLTSAGHLTVAVGYINGQHTLIFNDPYGNKNNGSWPNYNGINSYYDWPGYNNGYQNLNQMAWSVTGQATEPVYNDTIIDDNHYNHGFYVHNQGPSHMRYYRDKMSGGYNGHFWYTYTSASTTIDTCYVSWTPQIATAGNYEIFAYIPSTNANATTARYKVNYDGGSQTIVINQATNSGWVSLGTFPFAQGNLGNVRLGDGSGIASQMIAFDAMKWEYRPAAVGLNNFIGAKIKIYPNPATDKIYFFGNDIAEVKITDMLGRLILQDYNTKEVNVSVLQSGIYCINLYDGEGLLIHSQKLLKQ